MLFKGVYSFRGTHADKVIELTAPFDDKGNKLFLASVGYAPAQQRHNGDEVSRYFLDGEGINVFASVHDGPLP